MSGEKTKADLMDTKNIKLKHILLTIAIFFTLVLLIFHKKIHNRYYLDYRRSSSNACYANMKTIRGALEMYGIDNKIDFMTLIKDQKLTSDLFHTLKEEGYLQSIPMHPITNDPPHLCYGCAPDGIIFCMQHGFIQHNLKRKASVYAQLKAHGGINQDILDHAPKEPLEFFSKSQFIFDMMLIGIACFIMFIIVLLIKFGLWLSSKATKK